MATIASNNIDTGGGKDDFEERADENRTGVLRNSNSEGGIGSEKHGTKDDNNKDSNNSLRQVMSEVKAKTGVDIDIQALLEDVPDKTDTTRRIKPSSISSDDSTFQPNDLKSLKNKYDPRKSVNMSFILEEYGYPPKDVEKFHQQKKTKRLIDKYSSQKDDAEREAQKEREKREKYIRVYEEVHRLKNYYYEEYTDALREKIEKQRQEIQKRTENIENKLREKENKDKAAAQSRRLKSYKVTLTHDDDFLKQIPVSQFYKILLFQDRLKKEGRLKTQIDVDNFWHVIRQHHKKIHDMADLNRYLITKRSKKRTGDELWNRNREEEFFEEARDKFPEKYRPRVADIEENSRPSTMHSGREQPWAVTQMAKTKHKEKSEEKDHLLIAKEAAMALEKKYPQLHLPELSCFTLCVGAKTPKPQEMIDQLEARRRQKERLLYVTRVRRMYQLAGANIASTKRIMAKNNSEFPVLKYGAAVGDKINSEYMEPFKVEYEEPPPEPAPWLKYIPESECKIYPIEELTETDMPKSNKSKKTKSRSADESNRPERPQSTSQNKDPLQMKVLMKEDKVVEATCLSTTWKNYLGAGKSAFARD